MSWLASFVIGFINAIVGVFGVGTLAGLVIDWHRIPGREGGSSYHVILVGFFGGVLYFLAGLVGARLVAAGTEPSFLKSLGIVTGSSVGLLAVAALIGWLTADHDTTLHGREVQLHAEIKCPAGFVIPQDAMDDRWYAHIDTRSRQATSRAGLRLDEAGPEEGCLVIPVTLRLFTSVREKLLYVRLGENVQLFMPVFPSKPGKQYFAWSEWLDSVPESGQPQPEPAQRFRLRFRVQVVPPPETKEEAEARRAREDTTALAALTPQSPLEDILRFTHYSHSEDRRHTAGALLGRRPGLVAEMTEQILSPDQPSANRALRALAYIKPLPPELAPPVAVVGEKVIAAITAFNTAGPDGELVDQGVIKVSSLFSAWHEAQQALHEKAGVNGLPQLKKVLELSLQRQDSHAIKTDVARVAQFYVTKWSSQAGNRVD
jgi:hypothetical protein